MAKTNKFKYVAFATRMICGGGKTKTLVTKGQVITAAQYNKLPEFSQDCFWPVGMVELIDEIQNGPAKPIVNTVDYSKYSHVLNW